MSETDTKLIPDVLWACHPLREAATSNSSELGTSWPVARGSASAIRL